MLKKDSFSKGYGLITDYIAAILHELRNNDLTGLLKEYAKFDGSLSERDHLAIRKTFSGMVKLLYPDGNMTKEEAFEIIDFAAECRKRVKDQLYLIDETFKTEPALFKYINLKTGEEIAVETLERINNSDCIPQSSPDVKSELQSESAELKSETTDKIDNSEGGKRKRIPMLVEKRISFRLGQTGVSYKSLFAEYLQDAKSITIEDPFIRTFWQLKNLTEFLSMLTETRQVEGLKIHLITNEEDDKIPALIDDLDDIKEDLATVGLEFTYEFKDFHDRCIKTDTGWIITLGRGLDIFEPYNKFSLGAMLQSKRKCKEFSVVYSRIKE